MPHPAAGKPTGEDMRESALWAMLKRGMGKRWDATRHEDAAAVGVPDVSYGIGGANGWIELKCLDRWPKDPNAVVKIDHFTPLQRHWLMTRGKAGGRCWFLLKIEKTQEYMLFGSSELPGVGKSLTQDQMREQCYLCWSKKIDWNWLISIL